MLFFSLTLSSFLTKECLHPETSFFKNQEYAEVAQMVEQLIRNQ